MIYFWKYIVAIIETSVVTERALILQQSGVRENLRECVLYLVLMSETIISLKANASSAARVIRVPLGQIRITPGVNEALAGRPRYAGELLKRHQSGDWGCISYAERMENLAGLKLGWQIMSAYPIDSSLPCTGHDDNTIWIITEADRSVTTLLLPGEYHY